MEFKEGAQVVTADRKDVGVVDRVVIDPKDKTITNIVVRQGYLFTEDKVIPIDLVDTASEERVTLNVRSDNMPELPDFEEKQYVAADDEGDLVLRDYATGSYQRPLYWYPPLGAIRWGYPAAAYPGYGLGPDRPYRVEIEQNIPEGTIALREGASVYSSDGMHVGNVARVFSDPNTNQVTHILVEEGILFKDKKLVPASWARTMTEDKVYLVVSSRLLDDLEEYRP